MNTTFLKKWDNYSELEKLVKKAILKGIRKGGYIWQPTHNKESQVLFKPSTFSEIDNLLGFAYTSTGIYAGLWCCNGGYLLTQEDKHFVGFAINTNMEVIAITEDEEENPTYLNFSN